MRADSPNKSPQLACLLGGAVGDALGLPFEGLSPRRIGRWSAAPLRHRLIFCRGMLSDDTDHAVFTAQALLGAKGDVERFRRILAWRLRLWFLTLPAGIGWATLRSILRLWCGVSPARSGVWSAGNGPCMRAPLIGCQYADDRQLRHAYVDASTLLTHRDPKAVIAARALADVAAQLTSGRWKARPARAELLGCLATAGELPDWQQSVRDIETCFGNDDPIDCARRLFGDARGISGYVLHTLPFALVVWYVCYGNFERSLTEVIMSGGDTDSVAAIVGALAALSSGAATIPQPWINGIADWPHNVGALRRLAAALADSSQTASCQFALGLWPRSPFFMLLILAHGFRRLLPPY